MIHLNEFLVKKHIKQQLKLDVWKSKPVTNDELTPDDAVNYDDVTISKYIDENELITIIDSPETKSNFKYIFEHKLESKFKQAFANSTIRYSNNATVSNLFNRWFHNIYTLKEQKEIRLAIIVYDYDNNTRYNFIFK